MLSVAICLATDASSVLLRMPLLATVLDIN